LPFVTLLELSFGEFDQDSDDDVSEEEEDEPKPVKGRKAVAAATKSRARKADDVEVKRSVLPLGRVVCVDHTQHQEKQALAQ
jgi:hypothetical protein